MTELQPLPEAQINGGGAVLAGPSTENVGLKRQRRPNVRLGDIGDQTATLSSDAHAARRTKQWHDYKHHRKEGWAAAAAGKSSKTRPLINLGGGGGGNEFHETLLVESEPDKEPLPREPLSNLNGVAIGSWKVTDFKFRRAPAKRVRSDWSCSSSKVDEGKGGGDEVGDNDDVEDPYNRDRDFRAPGGSGSPAPGQKEESPFDDSDNEMPLDHRPSSERGQGIGRGLIHFHGHGYQRPFRGRVSEGRDQDPNELEGPSDTDARDWKRGCASFDMNDGGNTAPPPRGRCQYSEDAAIRIWLDGLGLGRYASVFEIHEVDDEVLPMLTLEDLKDMGISAVGSRRKMFCAIQQLGKGFS